MKIVLITMLSLFVIWGGIYLVNAERVSEGVFTHTEASFKEPNIKKEDIIKIGIHHFDCVNIKTLEKIFTEIELKKRYGNRFDIIIFHKDKEVLLITDPFIKKKMGELKLDYYRRVLLEGLLEENIENNLQMVVNDAEETMSKSMKIEMTLYHFFSKINISEPRFEFITGMIDPLEDIERSLR